MVAQQVVPSKVVPVAFVSEGLEPVEDVLAPTQQFPDKCRTSPHIGDQHNVGTISSCEHEMTMISADESHSHEVIGTA